MIKQWLAVAVTGIVFGLMLAWAIPNTPPAAHAPHHTER